MRIRVAAVLLVTLAASACEPPPGEPPRLVTIDRPEGVRLSLRELPGPVLEALGLRYGLAVVQADAIAERLGLRIGDVIYGVNQTRIGDAEEFRRLLAEQADGGIGLLVRRGRRDFYVMLEPGGALPPLAPPRDTLLRT